MMKSRTYIEKPAWKPAAIDGENQNPLTTENHDAEKQIATP
jgi:hypothetical protein